MIDRLKSSDEILSGAINKCQICSSKRLELIISLGYQPPPNSFLTSEQLKESEKRYPLDLYRCAKCGLVQITYAVDPKILFPPNFPYQTAMTKILRENFNSLAELLVHNMKLTNKDLVIDIGSNDGTLLKYFRDRGTRVLGVEPTDIAKIAMVNGIPTINKFFTEEIAEEIVSEYGKAKVITAANVFAHVNNLFSMIRGIHKILEDDGIFVSESHYVLNLIAGNQYDTIYHEHLRYYTLKPLIKLLQQFNLTVMDAEKIPTHGGSIRVFATKKKRPISRRLKKLLQEEEKYKLHESSTYINFRKRVMNSKLKLLTMLYQIKNDRSRIVGIGPATRGNTLLNYCNIGKDTLDYIAEIRGSLKIGLFTPGTHIPTVDEEILFREQPEYALLLPWYIADELMKKLRAKGYKGKFIIPLPEPRIVE